jgi:hypothetical protein
MADELDTLNEAKEVNVVANETIFANVYVKDLVDEASDAAKTIEEVDLIDEILVVNKAIWFCCLFSFRTKDDFQIDNQLRKFGTVGMVWGCPHSLQIQ